MRKRIYPPGTIRLLFLGIGLTTVLAAGAATARELRPVALQKTLPLKELCAAAVSRAEAAHNIPERLLTAISMVESGRWSPQRQRNVAWPWTVMAEGKGQYYPSKRAAIAAIRKLQARGVSNIDVGCMQVNLHYHPDAFPSLSAALDPVRNATYAAHFLASLKRDHGSWRKAVQHYHSATPKRRIPYQRKVYAVWKDSPKRVTTRNDRIARNRLHRLSRKVDRAHRAKLAAYKAKVASRKAAAAPARTGPKPAHFLTQWPPRSVKAQRRAQNLARSWAFGARGKAKVIGRAKRQPQSAGSGG